MGDPGTHSVKVANQYGVSTSTVIITFAVYRITYMCINSKTLANNFNFLFKILIVVEFSVIVNLVFPITTFSENARVILTNVVYLLASS